jgi:hypothetical protein
VPALKRRIPKTTSERVFFYLKMRIIKVKEIGKRRLFRGKCTHYGS